METKLKAMSMEKINAMWSTLNTEEELTNLEVLILVLVEVRL